MAKVAIVVPCYNQAPFIADALDSVLAQTSSDWECMFVDDGSTDGSAAVAQTYAARDARIRVVVQANGGLAAARNAGVRATSAPYILPLDADDRIAPTYVARAALELDTHASVDLVYGQAELFGAKSGRWELPAFERERLLIENMIYCSAMYRRAAWELCGGYDEHMKTIKQGLEDWDLWLGMLERGKLENIVFLDEVVFFYRIKDESMITALRRDEARGQKLLEYVFGRHRTLYENAFGTPYRVYAELFWTKRSIGHRWIVRLRSLRDRLRSLGLPR